MNGKTKSYDIFNITIEGDRLMLHNDQLANPFNEYAQELKKLNAQRKKSLEVYTEVAKVEFMGGLYYDETMGPYMPAHCLHKLLIVGGKKRKMGTVIAQNIIISKDINPILYSGPRTREELWEQKFYDQRLVGIGGTSKVLRTRPLFRNWKINFTAKAFPGAINEEAVRQAIEDAEMIGLGDGRPTYAGQFLTTKFEAQLLSTPSASVAA